MVEVLETLLVILTIDIFHERSVAYNKIRNTKLNKAYYSLRLCFLVLAMLLLIYLSFKIHKIFNLWV